MIIALMGVEGSGKSTVGVLLAESLSWEFLDGDSLHPVGNIEKMARGIALKDEDRKPWLVAIHKAMGEHARCGKNLVIACSALKQQYRDFLGTGVEVRWVYLRGSSELIRHRLQQRQGHFAGSGLLESQFEILEEPSNAVVVDIAQRPKRIVEKIRARLGV